jgi:hypothetical protein
VLETLILFVAVTAIASVVGLLWALHMRDAHVVVEQSDCGHVTFVGDGRTWTYAPELDECKEFRVGTRWLIEVNDFGTVRPRRKE